MFAFRLLPSLICSAVQHTDRTTAQLEEVFNRLALVSDCGIIACWLVKITRKWWEEKDWGTGLYFTNICSWLQVVFTFFLPLWPKRALAPPSTMTGAEPTYSHSVDVTQTHNMGSTSPLRCVSTSPDFFVVVCFFETLPAVHWTQSSQPCLSPVKPDFPFAAAANVSPP